jgi:hypothetical protein
MVILIAVTTALLNPDAERASSLAAGGSACLGVYVVRNGVCSSQSAMERANQTTVARQAGRQAGKGIVNVDDNWDGGLGFFTHATAPTQTDVVLIHPCTDQRDT